MRNISKLTSGNLLELKATRVTHDLFTRFSWAPLPATEFYSNVASRHVAIERKVKPSVRTTLAFAKGKGRQD